MSLYGGIFFEEEEKKEEKKEPSPEPQPQEPAAPQPAPKPQNWTASLKFAPVARRSKAATKPSLPPVPSAFASASAIPSSSAASSSSSTPKKGDEGAGVERGGLDSQNTQTTGNVNESTLQARAEADTSADTAQITQNTSLKPPPMTISDEELDDAAHMSGNYRRVLTKKEKKMKKKGQLPVAGPNWNDEYDPYKPTDYMEYKRFAEFLKEERMARRAEELSRQHNDYSSSEYSESDDEEGGEERGGRGDKDKFKMFAPPEVYDSDAHAPTAIDKEETGDEVFQRRLAMSSANAQQARMQGENVGGVEGVSEVESKQEVQQQAKQQDEQPDKAQIQPPQPPQPPPPSQTPEDRLKASQAAAASIAAKFSKLVPQKASTEVQTPQLPVQSTQVAPEVSEVDDFLSTIEESTVSKEQQERGENKANFAQRFMAKQGWKEGEGLGAHKTGIKEALSLEKSESGSGEIKSTEESGLDKQAREMFGEPSKTILLRNMVKLHEVDDDLSQEVAEECNKNGIVERVVVHTPQVYMEESDAVKIFVKFSGLVGAYKNVRALNGRYFGGTQIIARYYSDDAFNRGMYDR
ncbi:hypothetical protein E3P81_00523 [Wallemia ichthyophaga]|nr:hypothetical protein E3P97_00525 [Wallemia ichthyophaga]TIA99914.1 hypothetical protein E3P96_02794 [Wallemia ichthyophaga]TIB32362.1 hypothetical protein E3P85_01840 [Wallemia ichthyophaga]TIB50251.1 hypothetical protein E3P82_00514 [Wallemia ichthyophaga]TIB53970.1 hypothetical protein E3P81_00523 [Wallemia ichthyophaga]